MLLVLHAKVTWYPHLVENAKVFYVCFLISTSMMISNADISASSKLVPDNFSRTEICIQTTKQLLGFAYVLYNYLF